MLVLFYFHSPGRLRRCQLSHHVLARAVQVGRRDCEAVADLKAQAQEVRRWCSGGSVQYRPHRSLDHDSTGIRLGVSENRAQSTSRLERMEIVLDAIYSILESD